MIEATINSPLHEYQQNIDPQTLILETLTKKAVVKQTVYQNTNEAFKILKMYANTLPKTLRNH